MLTQLLLDTGIHSDFFWTREHNTGRYSDGIVVFLFCGAYESCVRRRLLPAALLGMRFSRLLFMPFAASGWDVNCAKWPDFYQNCKIRLIFFNFFEIYCCHFKKKV